MMNIPIKPPQIACLPVVLCSELGSPNTNCNTPYANTSKATANISSTSGLTMFEMIGSIADPNAVKSTAAYAVGTIQDMMLELKEQ